MIQISPGIERCRSALVFFAVMLAGIQVLAIVAGRCAIPITRGSALGILAASVALAWMVGARSGRRAAMIAERAREGMPEAEPLWTSGTRRSVAFLGLALLGAFVLLGWSGRDGSFDGNAYHVPVINQWAVHGRIGEVNPGLANSELMNGFPKGAEAVTFVFVEAFGGKLLGLLNVFYAPLGFLGITLLCGLFGASAADALLFGLCYLLTPASVLQFGTAYVDSAFASCVIAMLALLAWRLVMPPGDWLVDALAIGCAMGDALAAKTSGVMLVAFALVAFLAFDLARRNRADDREPPGARIRWMCVACSIAVVVGGYWYLRNFMLHGNPVYPLSVSIAGRTIWPGTPESQVLFEAANTPPVLLAMRPAGRAIASWTSLFDRADYSADRRLGALGAMWAFACLPAILAFAYGFVRRRVRDLPASAALGFVALVVVPAFLIIPMNWWGRYTLWVFALGLPCVCAALWLVRASTDRRLLLELWALACVGLLLLQDGLILTKDAKWTLAAMRIESREPHVLPLFPEMNGPVIRQILGAPGAIGVGPRELGHEVLIYGQIAQAGRIGAHELVPVGAKVSAAEVQILTDAHVRYVLWLTSVEMPPALASHAIAHGAEGPVTYLELVR